MGKITEQRTDAFDNWYRFNAKELGKETNLYYYGARYYNPSLSIWYLVDPLGEKMPSWSPFAYAFDNPIRFIDSDGMAPKDIIILNNPKGAGGFGHMAILVGSDKKGWTFISKEGRNKEPWYSNELTGGPALKPLVKEYKTLDDFRNDQKNDQNLKGYTQDIRFKATEKEDEMAKNATLDAAESWYNVVGANCGDAVSDGLNVAGLDGGQNTMSNAVASEIVKTPVKTKSSLDPRPNIRFEQIKKNNKEKIIPTDSIKRQEK